MMPPHDNSSPGEIDGMFCAPIGGPNSAEAGDVDGMFCAPINGSSASSAAPPPPLFYSVPLSKRAKTAIYFKPSSITFHGTNRALGWSTSVFL